jgi:hypothetical protein
MYNFLKKILKNFFNLFFYSIFFCFYKDKGNKLKKSNTHINLLDNIEKLESKNNKLTILDNDNKNNINNVIYYACRLCKKTINNNHYLVYDKHFCSNECRENFLIRSQLL